jgi:predicted dehydrogenase
MTGTGRVRYGVVGCGRVFQQFHLPCLDRPDVEIAAICDVDGERVRQVLPAAACDVFFTSDLEEFFSVGRLDAISVCTPNDAHFAPAVAALDAGVAVLCEKPLAAGLAQARSLAAHAAAATPLFGVNLPYRFHPLLPRFAQALRSGVEEVVLTMNTPGNRLWRPYSAWYDDVGRTGGGALLDLGPHALDLLTAAAGPAEVVSCAVDDLTGAESRAKLTLAFEGLTATVFIDRASRRPALTVEARGSGGEVMLDVRRNELRLQEQRISGAERPAELAAVDHFVDAVTGSGGTLVGADEALRLQELIADAYGSAVALQETTISSR